MLGDPGGPDPLLIGDGAGEADLRQPTIQVRVRAVNYEEAYEKAGSLREQARDFAMAYDAERVYQDCWEGILKELIPGG